MSWYLKVLKNYAVFKGRARRKEYWMFALFNVLIAFGLGFIEGAAGIAAETNASVLALIYNLAILIPAIAVTVRRLHDTGRTGWWFFIALIPFIGAIVLLVFMCLDSDSGVNQYGPNPKTAAAPRPEAVPAV